MAGGIESLEQILEGRPPAPPITALGLEIGGHLINSLMATRDAMLSAGLQNPSHFPGFEFSNDDMSVSPWTRLVVDPLMPIQRHLVIRYEHQANKFSQWKDQQLEPAADRICISGFRVTNLGYVNGQEANSRDLELLAQSPQWTYQLSGEKGWAWELYSFKPQLHTVSVEEIPTDQRRFYIGNLIDTGFLNQR